jgi:outer membrane protein insertion porin family
VSRRVLVALLLVVAAAPARPQGGGTASPPAGAPAGGEPARAASVTLVMPPGEDLAAATALLAVSRGAPVTSRDLRRTAQRLFQGGRCRNVTIREAEAPPPPGEAGRWVALQVTCEPHRLLGGLVVAVLGPSPLAEAALRAAAGLEVGAPVDAADLAAAGERVRTALRRRGHRQARVTGALQGERTAVATLEVQPGPATLVAEVRLAGAGGLEAALRPRLSLRPGAVLDEEALAADVAALRGALHEAGRWRGRVGAPVVRDGPEGVVVEVPVVPGPQVTVRFRGAVALTPADLRAHLGVEPGQAFDAPAIDAAADRLRAHYRARGYAAARVEAEERASGGELAVVFHVDEGRTYRLVRVRWEGSEWRSEPELGARLQALLEEELGREPPSPATERARALTASLPGLRTQREPPVALPPGTFLDEVALERACERLVDEYRGEGFLEAALLGWTADLDAARGEAAVTLRLREGARTTVESIGFEGNAEVPLAELAREARLAPGGPLVYEQVEATRVALLKLYFARSHLYARVEAREQVDPLTHQAQLRFVVDEGPRVRLGRIQVTGNTRTREDVVRRSLEVKEGALHDPEAMARSQAALLRLGVFRSVGLRLQDPELPEPVKDLAVELSERPWQYLAPGAGFSIADGPRLFLEYGRPNLLGRALELTARAKVNYPLPWLGRDFEPASPKNTFEGRADVGLRAPRLELFTPLGLPPVIGRADLIGERLRRPAYDVARATGILGADLPLTGRITLSLQYEVEVDRIDKTGTGGVVAYTQADLERLRFDEGTTTLHAIRPSATFDFRDNAAHPHQGWFASGSVELARSLGGPGGRFLFLPGSEIYTSLAKLQATASGYLPVGRATVLALSARGGRVVPLDGRSRTIIPKRFFLGGASTIRGFAEEEMVPEDLRAGLAEEARHCASSLSGAGCTPRGASLAGGSTAASEGGEAFLLLKGELRQTLTGSLELGLFVDLGNLWLDPKRYRLVDLRPSAGIGLRFITPVGPAALDLGFNLAPDGRLNERTFAPHFTIGLF